MQEASPMVAGTKESSEVPWGQLLRPCHLNLVANLSLNFRWEEYISYTFPVQRFPSKLWIIKWKRDRWGKKVKNPLISKKHGVSERQDFLGALTLRNSCPLPGKQNVVFGSSSQDFGDFDRSWEAVGCCARSDCQLKCWGAMKRTEGQESLWWGCRLLVPSVCIQGIGGSFSRIGSETRTWANVGFSQAPEFFGGVLGGSFMCGGDAQIFLP